MFVISPLYMMLLNSVLKFNFNSAVVFLQIIFLLSYFECGGPAITGHHHHTALRVHPLLRFQARPRFQTCQLFNNCENKDHHYLEQITENSQNENVGQKIIWISTTIRPPTESFFYNNFSTLPVAYDTNSLHGRRSSHLHNLFSNLMTNKQVPEFKDITENTKSNDVSTPHERRMSLINEFMNGLDKFERKFYMVTFKKLTDMTAGGSRADNAISFVQSALFLQLLLLLLSIDRNIDTKSKIDSCIGIRNNISDTERMQLIKDVVSMLPNSTDGLVFRLSCRLVLGPEQNVSEIFKNGAAALQLRIDQINGTETPEMLSILLNRMVEEDSRGAIHDTFDPTDVSGALNAVFLTTIYMRSSWRTAPTLLNGTRIFRDSYKDPNRTIRMIRVNDMMRYANLTECDAEAIEVFYLKPGLSLLILVPHGSSLRRLTGYVANVGLRRITSQMRTLRVAADLPLYTLRMSLLLPNKLETLGLSDLLYVEGHAADNELKMSHGLQRLMFWAEAGRNAFKDDGLDWDDPPQIKVDIDRPYLFYVRWNNMTLMNGHQRTEKGNSAIYTTTLANQAWRGSLLPLVPSSNCSMELLGSFSYIEQINGISDTKKY